MKYISEELYNELCIGNTLKRFRVGDVVNKVDPTGGKDTVSTKTSSKFPLISMGTKKAGGTRINRFSIVAKEATSNPTMRRAFKNTEKEYLFEAACVELFENYVQLAETTDYMDTRNIAIRKAKIARLGFEDINEVKNSDSWIEFKNMSVSQRKAIKESVMELLVRDAKKV